MTVVYLDISKAFFVVSHSILMTKLGCYRLEGCSTRWVKKLARLLGRKGCDQHYKV